MSTMIRSTASRYFNSCWIPSATAIVTLLCYTADRNRFQSRVTIGLAGKPWARANSESTLMKPGDKSSVVIAGAKPVYRSRCIIAAETLVLEVFEESDDLERRLTEATLVCLDEELRPLTASPDWKTVRQLLPVGSVKRGSHSFDLRKSFQPGIYNSEIWANPGEPAHQSVRAAHGWACIKSGCDRQGS